MRAYRTDRPDLVRIRIIRDLSDALKTDRRYPGLGARIEAATVAVDAVLPQQQQREGDRG